MQPRALQGDILNSKGNRPRGHDTSKLRGTVDTYESSIRSGHAQPSHSWCQLVAGASGSGAVHKQALIA